MNIDDSISKVDLLGSKESLKLPQSYFTSLLAWIICPVIILFSYMPMLNMVARGILVVFILWFFLSVVMGKKIYWPAPILIYLLWCVYSIMPSIFSPQPDYAINKLMTISLLAFVNLAVVNAIVWSGSIKPWAFAYLVALALSYISNYLPIQSLVKIDYETNVLGRTVGTFGNANAYGRAMVQGTLLAIVLLMQEKRYFWQLLLMTLLIVLTLAVLGSGSRTALVGFVLVVLGGLYSAGIKVVFQLRNLLLFCVSSAGFLVIIMLNPERFAPVFERMQILLSYVGLADKVNTKERSLEHRMELMEKALDVSLDYPLGIGLDNYRVVSGVYAHSNYFELLATVGLIGLLIYYLCYFRFYRWITRRKKIFESTALQKMLIVAVITMLAMDVSNVSYYSKSLWLFLSILSGQMLLLESSYKCSLNGIKK